jgi:A/G-specific adenine glycosylase
LEGGLAELTFAARLLSWFDVFGRHDLPWHQPRTAYHVWVSEIMLQQTQVQTVMPYYQRFMARFPDIKALADATTDEVLAHWAGLGYYARGRNLHKAAQIIQSEYAGEFPTHFEQIVALPGIGRSTAGAILAQAYQQRFAILDGNVKRVLTRFYAVEGWPGEKKVESVLWQKAEVLLQAVPDNRLADYTQAMMDLGASVCARARPGCAHCPLNADCQAWLLNRVKDFPASKPKKAMPIRETWMLLKLNAQGQVALQRRPDKGIWGGLYSLAEFDTKNAVFGSGVDGNSLLEWPSIKHTFSHFHLRIYPLVARAGLSCAEPVEGDAEQWFDLEAALALGLPAPIKLLLEKILEEQPFG